MEERIEKYITDQMSNAEKKAFETDLKRDASLRNELKAYKDGIQAARLKGRSQLKKRLQKLESTRSSTPKRWSTFPFFFLLLAGAGLAAFMYWYNLDKEKITPLEEPVEQKEQQDLKPEEEKTIDIARDQKTKEQLKKETPPKKTKPIRPSNKALFAQHFKVYEHPSLQPGTRGSGELSVREQIEKAYWEKNYNEVLELWNKLSDFNQKNGNLIFLKANALMATGSVAEAGDDFEQLLNLKGHRFKQAAEWYFALAKIYLNETSEAKEILHKITQNSSHKYKAKAEKLLESK